MYIGGGRTILNPIVADRPSIPFSPNPYVTGVAICAAGNGGSRDAGAGPAFTGFPVRLLAPTGTVLNGSPVVAGFVNRSNVSITNGQAVFTSETTALAAPA
jgi:hypothetical protein